MGVSCLAPWLALRFSPNGEIHACCVNDTYPLGRVDRDRLIDVWNGERMSRLRRALAAGDGSLGCQDCEDDDQRGRRASSHASHYDQFIGRTLEGWPLRLEFAMSNTCNLMCTHCNGDLSSAIRSQREQLPPVPDLYGEMFFSDIREFVAHAEVASFLGGEPFLGRHARRVWDHLIDLGREIEVNVTTNGTVWNATVERYMRALQMNVAVSIDSVRRKTFESIRVGADFDAVMENRDRIFELTRSYGGAFTINHCLLRQNVHELYDMLIDADRRGMRVQVIPVMYPMPQSPFSLMPDELQSVVSSLRSAEASGGPVTLNADGWHQMLEQLEAGARDPAELGTPAQVAVSVGVPRRRLHLLYPTELLSESIQAQTDFGGGAAPLRVELVDGRVATVDSPAWADLLQPESWIGLRDEQILASICDRVGGEATWDVRMRWSQVTEVDLTIAGPGGDVVLRVHFFDWPDDELDRRVFVVASADLVGTDRA